MKLSDLGPQGLAKNNVPGLRRTAGLPGSRLFWMRDVIERQIPEDEELNHLDACWPAHRSGSRPQMHLMI